MARYLLDTNHLSPLVTPEHSLRKIVGERVLHGDEFAVIPIVIHECMYGFLSLRQSAQSMHEWLLIREEFKLYTVDTTDAEQAARLRLDLRRQGWQLGLVDALIAVVAMRYGLTLLTTDKDFTAVVGLSQENWL